MGAPGTGCGDPGTTRPGTATPGGAGTGGFPPTPAAGEGPCTPAAGDAIWEPPGCCGLPGMGGLPGVGGRGEPGCAPPLSSVSGMLTMSPDGEASVTAVRSITFTV